jgi:hypothetical protein
MPVPFPDEATALKVPPDAEEVALLSRGIVGAVRSKDGLTPLQDVLLRSIMTSMTGHLVDPTTVEPMGPEEFALALARRDQIFRTRIVQVMLLAELVLVPLPADVTERVDAYATELGVADAMLNVAREYAHGSLGLAMLDFERNGYMADWDPSFGTQLHTSHALSSAWQECVHDDELAARWDALADCAPGTLGRGVTNLYRARGFVVPGRPGSAPPYLAQHDWVHVVADFATTVESELEVFGLIARAIPDPRGFSLLAMVVSLFETGYLMRGAGLFQYDRGHLSKEGMAIRLGDAMRRGAMCGQDLMAVDWFELADLPVEQVRTELNMPPKSPTAIAAGSLGPWEHGAISAFQLAAGQKLAEAEGRDYDAFGAA